MRTYYLSVIYDENEFYYSILTCSCTLDWALFQGLRSQPLFEGLLAAHLKLPRVPKSKPSKR